MSGDAAVSPRVPALLACLRRLGVALTISGPGGDRLAFDAPAGALTPELKALLVPRKAELLAVLAGDYPRAALALLLTGEPDARRRWDVAEWFDAQVMEYERGGMGRGEAQRRAYAELARGLEATVNLGEWPGPTHEPAGAVHREEGVRR